MGAVLFVVGLVLLIIAVRRDPKILEKLYDWPAPLIGTDCGLTCFRKRGHEGFCDSSTCVCGCGGWQHRTGEEEHGCRNYRCSCKKFTPR